MKYIVIGLGSFGATLATTLTDLGHEVIGVDIDENQVEAIKDKITHAITLNATNEQSLKTLPLDSADTVIIGIGKDAGSSIMATALLKKLEVKEILCRAVSDIHQTVLETMGVEKIIHPERETAERLAMTLELDHVLEAFSLTNEFKIAEVEVPRECIGQTIEALQLPQRYNLLILTLKRNVRKKNLLGVWKPLKEVVGVIKPGEMVREGDVMVVFGTKKDIKRFVG
jgi:trk system potassium uptake protein TrkA